jgi:hypothetical protein
MANLVYGSEASDKVQVRVNQNAPLDVKLPGAIYTTVRIPVDLKNGDNSIEFRFAAEGAVNIDRMAITR